MDEKREPVDGDSEADFDLDWESLNFSLARSAGSESISMDDWEERYDQDTTGYVPDPATTSFTDIDLGPALTHLRATPGWADLDSWSDA